MQIESLEARLRERTKKELNDEIIESISPARRLIGNLESSNFPMTVKHGDQVINVHIPLYDFFSQYEERLKAVMFEKRHSDSILKFLAQVESLQEQVNSLRDLSSPVEY